MLACLALAGAAGCHLIIPDVSHQPVVRNPFPQLSRVAVAPFFNQSDEATVDGRKFALAYYSELQATAGFEVVPLGVVEEAILAHQVDLSSAGEARRLARILGVDVVVIGSVTDYTPYYPPRCGLRVEWYAANPGFHEIPPGYGLPWGRPEEEFIPEPLVFEAEMALAKAQLATQTPACELAPIERLKSAAPAPTLPPLFPNTPTQQPTDESDDEPNDSERPAAANTGYETAAEEELPGLASEDSELRVLQSERTDAADTTGVTVADGATPLGWPHEGPFVPQPPCAARPACIPTDSPVMTHTRIYHGHDGDFTEALASYYHFRNDARFGGWQNYLQRSDDFVRFCCHMHIAEMLSARGGADQTRVVWQWPDCR